MKRNHLVFILFAVVLFAFSSCQKEPSANFSASKQVVFTDEEISFYNTSVDSESYHWDFGDGNTSVEVSPKHSYYDEGTYLVTLVAYSKKKENKKTETITVNRANEIRFEGTKYALSKASATVHATVDSVTPFTLYILSNGLSYSTESGFFGTGEYITANLYSEYRNGIKEGTYRFGNPELLDTIPAFTFTTASTGINYDSENPFLGRHDVTGGTIKVERNGDNFIFDISFSLNNSKSLIAYYKGTLARF
jgi:PKD repeat protein